MARPLARVLVFRRPAGDRRPTPPPAPGAGTGVVVHFKSTAPEPLRRAA